MTIIGDKAKRKHEKNLGDSRLSITLYRVGAVGGATGPTEFLLSGVRCRSGYTEEFLCSHGAAVGSSITMTPTGYMTDLAWEQMTPRHVAGIRSMPFVRDNPQWWTLEILDGAGPHHSQPGPLQLRRDNKILSLKEESQSSHICQTYDRITAKTDKSTMRGALQLVRRARNVTQGVVDQYALLHVGLPAVREVNKHPEVSATLFV